MQPRRVVFPDSIPFVAAACRSAVPGATVVAKRPASLVKGSTVVQYRNDSGPDRGFFKDEAYGINCWAPTLREAFEALRLVQAQFKSNLAGVGPIVAGRGGAGPFEVVDDADSVGSHAHAYCTVGLTVRGANF